MRKVPVDEALRLWRMRRPKDLRNLLGRVQSKQQFSDREIEGICLLAGVSYDKWTRKAHEKVVAGSTAIDYACTNTLVGVCTSLPTTPHLVVGRSACRVGVRPSLNRSWAQRSRPVVQAGRRAFPGDESVVD